MVSKVAVFGTWLFFKSNFEKSKSSKLKKVFWNLIRCAKVGV